VRIVLCSLDANFDVSRRILLYRCRPMHVALHYFFMLASRLHYSPISNQIPTPDIAGLAKRVTLRAYMRSSGRSSSRWMESASSLHFTNSMSQDLEAHCSLFRAAAGEEGEAGRHACMHARQRSPSPPFPSCLPSARTPLRPPPSSLLCDLIISPSHHLIISSPLPLSISRLIYFIYTRTYEFPFHWSQEKASIFVINCPLHPSMWVTFL
jgi:hypothetical protein